MKDADSPKPGGQTVNKPGDPTFSSKLKDIYWIHPLKRGFTATVMSYILLAISFIGVAGLALSTLGDYLPQKSELNSIKGVITEAKDLGPSRRGLTFRFTVKSDAAEITFYNRSRGRPFAEAMLQSVGQPVEVLWGSHPELTRLRMMPQVWSLEINGKELRSYEHLYEINRSSLVWKRYMALFFLFYGSYLLVINYVRYRKEHVA